MGAQMPNQCPELTQTQYECAIMQIPIRFGSLDPRRLFVDLFVRPIVCDRDKVQTRDSLSPVHGLAPRQCCQTSVVVSCLAGGLVAVAFTFFSFSDGGSCFPP